MFESLSEKLKKMKNERDETADISFKPYEEREVAIDSDYEQVERTTLAGAMEIYTAKEPRGEYVLVIEGAGETAETGAFWQDMSIQEHVRHYVDTGMSEKDAIKAAAKDRGVHKNEVYSVVVEQKNAQK